MPSETARTNNNQRWTPEGPISRKMLSYTARLRELADKLPNELREEANAIAKDVASDALRVNGLELKPLN